ncbi:hypothetical protein H0264_29555 [Nocardia huaxiensis]|uniref:Uncharacterized protein n=1 Tax=Nocardia huaxiensis TaxID=2755382 RepID=A0A7D6ZGP4_9NOCA|nr:hypothetical protein H0264_29555 [Nocardia huaxiensis]
MHRQVGVPTPEQPPPQDKALRLLRYGMWLIMFCGLLSIVYSVWDMATGGLRTAPGRPLGFLIGGVIALAVGLAFTYSIA